MFTAIQVHTIECGSAEPPDHSPLYCAECYVSYTSTLCTTMTKAAKTNPNLIYEIQFTWKEQIDEETSRGVLTVVLAAVLTMTDFAPEYYTWIVAKLLSELHDDCNWDLNQ